MSKVKCQIPNLNFKSFAICVLVLSFAIGVLRLAVDTAMAQTFSLSLYPPLLEVMIMPGKSITQAYQITNLGDKTVINTQVVAFEPEGELGNIRLPLKVEPLKGWFNFENADIALGQPFTLNSGQSQQIVLKIKIPEDTREDDYYFTLLFSTKPQSIIPGSGAQQAGIIGANILITVSRDGKPVKKGEIVEFKLLNCYLAKLLPFCLTDSLQKPEFLLRVKNTGKTFWKPFGKIKTEGLLRQSWEREILPDNILADSVRQVKMATTSASPSFLIGPYRAKTEIALDEDGPKLTTATSFLALPLKVIFVLIVLFILISFGKKFLKIKDYLTRVIQIENNILKKTKK